MTDVKAKTPNKRKSLEAAKPASAKKPKVENEKTPAKTPKKQGKTPNKPKPSPNKAKQTPNKQKQSPKPEASPKQAQTPKPKPTPKNKAKTPKVEKEKSPVTKPTPTTNGNEKKKVKPFKGVAALNEEGKPTKERRRIYRELVSKVKDGDKSADLIADLDRRINAILVRKELTKTAKRKLSVLKRLKLRAEGKWVEKEDWPKRDTKPPKKRKAKGKVEEKKKQAVGKKNANKAEKKPEKVEEEEVEDEEEESDSEDEEPAEKKIKVEPKDDPWPLPKIKQEIDVDQLKKVDLIKKEQKRFVLFVGNIAYDTTREDLTEHFKKAGEIRHIRIPLDKKSNKPRGFAYVEMCNEEGYQKCLSMHHTFLKNRRINVLYTEPGKKKGEEKKQNIKSKNFKLHAMRKQGQLKGSKKDSQKRAFRRKKVAIKKEVE